MEITVKLDTVNKAQAGFKGDIIRTEETRAYSGSKERNVYEATVYIDRDVWDKAGRPNELIIMTMDALDLALAEAEINN